LKPVVRRRVVRRTAHSSSKRAVGLSCEIARIRTRDFHLTTGTFNLVVKDRIAFPPERRAFSPGGAQRVRTDCPRNLCLLWWRGQPRPSDFRSRSF